MIDPVIAGRLQKRHGLAAGSVTAEEPPPEPDKMEPDEPEAPEQPSEPVPMYMHDQKVVSDDPSRGACTIDGNAIKDYFCYRVRLTDGRVVMSTESELKADTTPPDPNTMPAPGAICEALGVAAGSNVGEVAKAITALRTSHAEVTADRDGMAGDKASALKALKVRPDVADMAESALTRAAGKTWTQAAADLAKSKPSLFESASPPESKPPVMDPAPKPAENGTGDGVPRSAGFPRDVQVGGFAARVPDGMSDEQSEERAKNHANARKVGGMNRG